MSSSKPKKLSFRLIDRKDGNKITEPYRIMEDLVSRFHPHLKTARICLAWNVSWKEDKDGHLVLGKCRKAADLDRSLHEYDFIILLNEDAWGSFDAGQRAALVDHELCHAAVDLDDEGEPREDESGRTVYRVRKHDIEEFKDIVERHGCYKSDLAEFAKAVLEAKNRPLFKLAEGE